MVRSTSHEFKPQREVWAGEINSGTIRCRWFLKSWEWFGFPTEEVNSGKSRAQ